MSKNKMSIKLSDYPAYFINLDSNTRSNRAIKKMLLGDFAITKAKRVSGVLDANKVHGINLAFQKAFSVMSAPAIILEDDARPKRIVREIEIPSDEDALYLGHMSWGEDNWSGSFNVLKYEAVEGFSDIYRIYNMLGAHAILFLTKDYFEFIKREIEEAVLSGTPQDIYMARSQKHFNVYAVGDPIFYQDGFYEGQSNKHITKYSNFSYAELVGDGKDR